MKSVTDENTLILQARMHGISKSTLHDHISENVTHGDKPGPDQLLSPAEEEEPLNFLIEIAQAGYRKTRKEIRNIAGRVTVNKKRRKTPDMIYLNSPNRIYNVDEIGIALKAHDPRVVSK